MQDFWVLLRLDSISWLKTLENNFMQRHVREYTLPREHETSQPKGCFQGNTKIGPVLEVTTSYLHGKHRVEIRIMSLSRTILIRGSEFLMDLTNLWWIWTTTTQKLLKISSKVKRYNWMQKIWWTDQRRKQNHKEKNLLALHQESFLWKAGNGLILNQGNILSLSTKFRRKWFIFFVIHRKYIEKKMERFISGEQQKIFRIHSHNLFIGLTIDGKHVWQQEEQKGDSSTVLMIQEQSFVSELFMDIQDAILLILRYRTI